MGKNLKGKEIGKGISQRKDGLYCTRFVNKREKRQERCFSTLPEARNWLDDAKHTDKYGNASILSAMTVDDWSIVISKAFGEQVLPKPSTAIARFL